MPDTDQELNVRVERVKNCVSCGDSATFVTNCNSLSCCGPTDRPSWATDIAAALRDLWPEFPEEHLVIALLDDAYRSTGLPGKFWRHSMGGNHLLLEVLTKDPAEAARLFVEAWLELRKEGE